MLMFFNWVDLWLAATIILPVTPTGCGDRGGQQTLKQQETYSNGGTQ